MVSAFVHGPSLRDWVARQDGPVAPEEASAFMAQVADGVGYFHDCGIVHRDLKPANVLLERSEKADHAVISDLDLPLANFVPRVSDFGLAKCLELDDGQTRSGTILGTPRYMAPEQAEGRVRAITASSDVFALGVIMYELLTRQTPSWESAESGRVLISPRRHVPRISQELETICRRCLERDPGQRFSNAREMAAALRSAPPSESNGGWLSRAWRKATKGRD
jgi:serine/threonine protein kinase